MKGKQAQHLSTSISIVMHWTVARHRRVLARYLMLVATSVSIATITSVTAQTIAANAADRTLKLTDATRQSEATKK